MTVQTEEKIFHHDFILAFFSLFSFALIFHSLLPTLPIYLSRLGSTEAQIGLLVGSFTVSSLVLRPFVGKALLKIPEKKFMLIGVALNGVTCLAYLFAPPFWPFLAVRVIQGVGFAFFHTASFTLAANVSLEGHRGRSLSYFVLAPTFAAALAPPVAILLANQVSFTILFLICAGLSLCGFFLVSKLKKNRVTPSQGSSSEEGFFISRKALPPSIMNALALFGWGALATFFPLYAIDHGVTNPGLFFTTIAVMLILGRALGGKMLDRYPRGVIILPSLATCILSMVILAFSKTFPMFILVAIIWGAGYSFLTPTLITFALDRVGSSPSLAMGTFTAISDLGISLGPVVMGFVIHATGYSSMFLGLALIELLNLNYFYFFAREKG
jgi:predicted MFS family arabinose efflux permease